MTIKIIIPELECYIYDLEYKIICKFFGENLGEQP